MWVSVPFPFSNEIMRLMLTIPVRDPRDPPNPAEHARPPPRPTSAQNPPPSPEHPQRSVYRVRTTNPNPLHRGVDKWITACVRIRFCAVHLHLVPSPSYLESSPQRHVERPRVHRNGLGDAPLSCGERVLCRAGSFYSSSEGQRLCWAILAKAFVKKRVYTHVPGYSAHSSGWSCFSIKLAPSTVLFYTKPSFYASHVHFHDTKYGYASARDAGYPHPISSRH